MRKILVLANVGGFRCRPESVAPCLFLDLLLADSTSILGVVRADKHVFQIFVAVFLDPVKYLIVFHFNFLLPVGCVQLFELLLQKNMFDALFNFLNSAIIILL